MILSPKEAAPAVHRAAAFASPDVRPGRGLSQKRLANLVIHLLFFFSGMASLICEVVWFKQLQFVLGSSTYAVSVVVACFFGGLACGSWLGGRLADRWRRLLRGYAALEFALGVVAVGVTLLLATWASWIEGLAAWVGPQAPLALPLMILVSLVILLPPTALMGATLPVLARFLVAERSQLAQRIGVLYGLNTLGAVAGCILVGFVLIAGLGVMASALVAAGIYLAIAAAALGLDRLDGLAPAAGPAAIDARADVALGKEAGADAANPALARSGRLLLLAFALMGFTAIAYEVLWFRLLIYFGTHSVYAFAGMLATYLLGLVFGALLCARYLAPRKDRHLVYFARLQLVVAAAALLSLAMLGRGRNLLTGIVDIQHALGTYGLLGPTLTDAVSFAAFCLVVLVVPTTLIGIGFPLATEVTIHRLSRLGSRLGGLYSLNTLGGVAGSLVAGFVLLPLVGSQGSFTLIVLLNLGLFALIVGSQPALRRQAGLWREGAVVLTVSIVAFGVLGGDYLEQALTRFEGATVADFRESADATFTVLDYDSPHAGRYQQLLVNGWSYANNSPPGRRYMSTLGHLPALLHRQPRSALVICVGTGSTVGSLTLHPELKDIAAVDIAADVFAVAPHFVPLNHRFFEAPAVRSVAADGRHFLLCNEEQFDLLTFEPPPPSGAGVVNLYSREFYQVAKRRMKPGAVLCQWVPLDMPQEALPRMMLKTLMAEFPHVSLWIPNRMEGVAIASLEPLRIDVDRLQERMAAPALQADLKAYGMGRPEQVLATFVAADDDLVPFVGDAPLVTDDRPRIEYYHWYPRTPMRYEEVLRHRRPVEAHLNKPWPAPAALETARQVTMHLWLSHERQQDKNLAAARDHVEQALGMDPENQYLLYLRAEVAR